MKEKNEGDVKRENGKGEEEEENKEKEAMKKKKKEVFNFFLGLLHLHPGAFYGGRFMVSEESRGRGSYGSDRAGLRAGV